MMCAESGPVGNICFRGPIPPHKRDSYQYSLRAVSCTDYGYGVRYTWKISDTILKYQKEIVGTPIQEELAI